MSEYDDSSLQVLQGVAPVRKRPGMYIGDVGTSGLHHLTWMLVHHVIDQHITGYATELRVDLTADHELRIEDDGPGLSVEPHRAFARDAHAREVSELEHLFTSLAIGARFLDHFPFSGFGPRYGADLGVVSALAARLDVETTWRGIRWAQSFERGEAVTALRRLGPTSREGTIIRLRADPDIFPSVAFDPERIRTRLEELARLEPHLRIRFQERRLPARGGILGWARELAGARGPVEDAFLISQIVGETRVQLAFAWKDAGPPITRSFVNLHETTGGTHVDAVWHAFTAYARSVGAAAQRTSTVREALGRGLVSIVDVSLFTPTFEGCLRERLTSPEAGRAVARAIRAWLAGQYSWSARRFVRQRLGAATR